MKASRTLQLLITIFLAISAKAQAAPTSLSSKVNVSDFHSQYSTVELVDVRLAVRAPLGAGFGNFAGRSDKAVAPTAEKAESATARARELFEAHAGDETIGNPEALQYLLNKSKGLGKEPLPFPTFEAEETAHRDAQLKVHRLHEHADAVMAGESFPRHAGPYQRRKTTPVPETEDLSYKRVPRQTRSAKLAHELGLRWARHGAIRRTADASSSDTSTKPRKRGRPPKLQSAAYSPRRTSPAIVQPDVTSSSSMAASPALHTAPKESIEPDYPARADSPSLPLTDDGLAFFDMDAYYGRPLDASWQHVRDSASAPSSLRVSPPRALSPPSPPLPGSITPGGRHLDFSKFPKPWER